MKKQILLCILGSLGAIGANGQGAAAQVPRTPATAPQAPLTAPPPPLTAAPSGSPTLQAPPTWPAPPTWSTAPAVNPQNQGLQPGEQQGLLGVQQGALGSNVLGMSTNAMFATNQFATNAIFAIPDQAITIPDQRLLVQIRSRVTPVLRSAMPGLAFMPVHFLVQQNVVTAVGQVVTEPQKQEIVALVQQTPGVVTVVDKLTVNPQLNMAAVQSGSTNGGVIMTTNPAPTGRPNGVNRIFESNTVAPGPLQGTQQLPPARP